MAVPQSPQLQLKVVEGRVRKAIRAMFTFGLVLGLVAGLAIGWAIH